MSITIKVRVSPGTDIADAVREALRLARRLEIAIEFDFNGVKCIATPFPDDARSLTEQWRSELKSDHQIKVVAGGQQ